MLTLKRWLVVYYVLGENHLIVGKGFVADVLDCARLTPIRSHLINLSHGVWSFNRATVKWNLGLLIHITTSSISSTFRIFIINLCWVVLFISVVFTKLLGLVDVGSSGWISRIQISYIIWKILLSILVNLILVILAWLIIIIQVTGYFWTNSLPLLVKYLTLSNFWEILTHIISLISI